MEIVHSDINNYLRRNTFPSRTVLVFPPFNGFRRFLIHKLVEDNFASSQVAAFSIGQDTDRRIVLCFKGLLRGDQAKSVPALPSSSRLSMIEKEQLPRQRLTPTAAVYRPPAARLADTRRSLTDDVKTSDTKRVRRPAQQLYVPRPKRVSYGNELPRSRSHSSSRTSIDSDSCNERSNNKTEDKKFSEANTETHFEHESSSLSQQQNISKEEASCSKEPANSALPESTDSSTLEMVVDTKVESECDKAEDKQAMNSHSAIESAESSIISVGNEVPFTSSNPVAETYAIEKSDNPETGCEDCLKSQSNGGMHIDSPLSNPDAIKDKHEVSKHSLHKTRSIEENEVTKIPAKPNIPRDEAMETISISSDSRDDISNSLTHSSSDSRESESSSENEAVRKSEKMQIEPRSSSKLSANQKNDCDSKTCEPREKNKKNRRIFPNVPVSDVLIISDSSSSSDSFKMASDIEPKKEIRTDKVKKQARSKETKIEKPAKKETVDLGDDWEALYDDSGECLVPDLMEELTNSVGRVRVASADSDYRQFQTIEERTNDGECIIEIYDFPAEFKTTDLINIFAPYRSRNFQIKWVDDTHALGVFPSPLMADEVLACTLPFVKTRPLRLGIAESRVKARNLVLPALPPMERPKTCTALARRLVSGALGLRLPTSSQDREKERQMLKEAREKRRLEAKQREAAWDGTISSESCI